MSRDLTPYEIYLSEQKHGDLFDFLESLKFIHPDGKEELLNSPEEIAIRKQFPQLGKFLIDDFPNLYKKLSEIKGGLVLLHQKDEELKKCIDSKGQDCDKDSYLIKWFAEKIG